MRALGIAFLLCASLAGAQTPRREGTYRPAEGQAASWRISENHTLVWGGAPYTPVGARVDGNPEAVGAAQAEGVSDLLIDLPLSGDWSPAVAAAEANKQRYLVRLASPASRAAGIAVDPAAYRVAGLMGSKHIDIELPNATQALVVVADQRLGSIVNWAAVPVNDGRLVFDTKANANLANVVLIYPRTDKLEMPDLWEGFDVHRDALLARLRRTRFGAGLRGVIDPLGADARLPERELRAVPTSPAFQAELATVLEANYKNVENAMAAWSLGASSLSTYEGGAKGTRGVLKTTLSDLARLVPLWSGTRGVSAFWDPTRDLVFNCDRNKSNAWRDISEATARAASRRTQRLCDAIRQVVDVPVVQEWEGWTGVTEDRQPAFDGVAAKVAGTAPSALLDSAARAVSTATRWTTRGWLVATDVDVPSKDLDASLNDLANLGLRAAFVKNSSRDVALAATGRATAPVSDFPINALFYPENAANPAAVQRLPGGNWWLPTPEDGNRIDFGRGFFGYRMASPDGTTRIVMWARTPGRYLLRMLKNDTVTFTTLDGSNSDPKKDKKGVTVTLTEYPLVIEGTNELPIPEAAVKETLDDYARLAQYAENGRRVGTDETYAFTEAATNFDGNPGGSFLAMRRMLRRFAELLSPIAWVEAESTRETTFSEIAPLPGASGNQALLLRSLLPPTEGYTATYSVPVADRNAVELWVAARLSPERRRELEATVGGQTLLATENPISSYGAGFAWYHLGTTRLTGNVAKVSLRMLSGPGAEAAIDTLVFAPPDWRPNGVQYPYELIGTSTTNP